MLAYHSLQVKIVEKHQAVETIKTIFVKLRNYSCFRVAILKYVFRFKLSLGNLFVVVKVENYIVFCLASG